MLMLALLPIGLLALRCVDTLATRFGDLLFNFFVLIIGTLVAQGSAGRSTCCSTLAPRSRLLLDLLLIPLLLLPLISLLLILLYILFLFLLLEI